MTRSSFMPWNHVLIAAASFTPTELCQYADEARTAGTAHLEAGWLEALSLHARRHGWGELVEAGMLASIEGKEERGGLVQGG